MRDRFFALFGVMHSGLLLTLTGSFLRDSGLGGRRLNQRGFLSVKVLSGLQYGSLS